MQTGQRQQRIRRQGVFVRLIQTRPQQYKLDGNEKLRFLGDFTDNETRVQAVRDLLDTLDAPKAA